MQFENEKQTKQLYLDLREVVGAELDNLSIEQRLRATTVPAFINPNEVMIE